MIFTNRRFNLQIFGATQYRKRDPDASAPLMPAMNFWNAAQGSYDSREDFDTVVKQGGK